MKCCRNRPGTGTTPLHHECLRVFDAMAQELAQVAPCLPHPPCLKAAPGWVVFGDLVCDRSATKSVIICKMRPRRPSTMRRSICRAGGIRRNERNMCSSQTLMAPTSSAPADTFRAISRHFNSCYAGSVESAQHFLLAAASEVAALALHSRDSLSENNIGRLLAEENECVRGGA